MYSRLPRSTLFPYTTLFRSEGYPGERREIAEEVDGRKKRRPHQVPRAQPQADRHAQHDRQREADADPEQRGDQVVEEPPRSEEHTSELQSRQYLVCRLLLEK